MATVVDAQDCYAIAATVYALTCMHPDLVECVSVTTGSAGKDLKQAAEAVMVTMMKANKHDSVNTEFNSGHSNISKVKEFDQSTASTS